MGFFGLDVWKKIWKLTHMIHNTHNCLSQNFMLVAQAQVWKIDFKCKKNFQNFEFFQQK